MKKVSNTFNKGLIMDVSPLSTTGDSLSDCLNGTFCTMNGDELVLQNDMGNGRVQTAYLPKGYIPIGTTQLGGIIYIASYNPFTNKCQIGSFPSPQRTSDKRDKLEKEIPLDKDENIIRVVLSDEIFKPGDKFYLTIPGQYMQYKYTESLPEIKVKTENKSEAEIQAEIKKAKIAYVKNHFLKFSVAIISEESQIIKLNEDPIIEEPKNNTEDDFTKDINKFKVCTSKISGKLILIIERVTFDYSINFNAFGGTNSENKKTFYLNFNLNANSQDKFFPNRLELTSLCKYANTLYGQKLIFPTEGEFTSGNSPDFRSFNYSAKNIYNNDVIDPVTTTTVNRPGSSTDDTTISKLIERLTNSGYWNKVNNPVYLKILATLYTNNFKINSEGEKIGECLPAATKQYVIDLSKVASNTVELSRYTYTIVDGSSISAEITFALQTYLDSAYEIKNITVTIYNVKEDSVNKVDSKSLGTSVKPVNFENLDNNYLYLVEFQIKTGSIEEQEDGSFDEKIINIYRYLYSNPNIVASFDKKLTDYEQAVPTLTLEAKVEDEKLIPDNPSSSEINYPHGLANTDNVTFTGIEKQIWELKKEVSIVITESNKVPIKVKTIKANNKECKGNLSNQFTISTGLENQELQFNYEYNKSDPIKKQYNVLERVSDYLYISSSEFDIEQAHYPGFKDGVTVYDQFIARHAGYNFYSSTFQGYYSPGHHLQDIYSEDLYGTKTNGKYMWKFVKFIIQGQNSGNCSIYETIPKSNSKESNVYLISPGGSCMLFTLSKGIDFPTFYILMQDIFNNLYTFKPRQDIYIYHATSVKNPELKTIEINKTISVSDIDMDLHTNNVSFKDLAEKYNIFYDKNNYKSPVIKSQFNIQLNQTKDNIGSKLLQNYKIAIDSENDVLVKSNNILYHVTGLNLKNDEIYTVQIQDINKISISNTDLDIPLSNNIIYKGVNKQFEARNGRLYTKGPLTTDHISLRYNSSDRVVLNIKSISENVLS